MEVSCYRQIFFWEICRFYVEQNYVLKSQEKMHAVTIIKYYKVPSILPREKIAVSSCDFHLLSLLLTFIFQKNVRNKQFVVGTQHSAWVHNCSNVIIQNHKLIIDHYGAEVLSFFVVLFLCNSYFLLIK